MFLTTGRKLSLGHSVNFKRYGEQSGSQQSNMQFHKKSKSLRMYLVVIADKIFVTGREAAIQYSKLLASKTKILSPITYLDLFKLSGFLCKS